MTIKLTLTIDEKLGGMSIEKEITAPTAFEMVICASVLKGLDTSSDELKNSFGGILSGVDKSMGLGDLHNCPECDVPDCSIRKEPYNPSLASPDDSNIDDDAKPSPWPPDMEDQLKKLFGNLDDKDKDTLH